MPPVRRITGTSITFQIRDCCPARHATSSCVVCSRCSGSVPVPLPNVQCKKTSWVEVVVLLLQTRRRGLIAATISLVLHSLSHAIGRVGYQCAWHGHTEGHVGKLPFQLGCHLANCLRVTRGRTNDVLGPYIDCSLRRSRTGTRDHTLASLRRGLLRHDDRMHLQCRAN